VSAHRQGRAELAFTRRHGRTVLAHSHLTAPLTMVRPFPLPGGRQLVQLISLGPGLCGGDRIDLRIVAEAGADVVVTTTAATRVLSMREGQHAEQRVRIEAHAGATVEYYPLVTIPFPDSAFAQTVRVDAANDARVGVLETWALGRAARGEYLEFHSLGSRTRLHVDGDLLYGDATELQPRDDDVSGAAVLAGRRYLASGFWYGATAAAPPQDAPATSDLLLAFAQARDGLVYLRALANDAARLDAALTLALTHIDSLWGHEAVSFGRFRC
jgi:urease accessory protein